MSLHHRPSLRSPFCDGSRGGTAGEYFLQFGLICVGSLLIGFVAFTFSDIDD